MHCGNALKACVKPGKTVAVAVTALVPMVTATGVADLRRVDLTVIAVANPVVITAKPPKATPVATMANPAGPRTAVPVETAANPVAIITASLAANPAAIRRVTMVRETMTPSVITTASVAVTTAKLHMVVQAATTGRHPMASTTAVVRGIHGVDPPLGRD